MSIRPVDLPDFAEPPLSEVVLGVQFTPPKGYQSIHAGEVWGLYKDQYPTAQELPPLPPVFETFGLRTSGFSRPTFNVVNGLVPSRYWFLRSDGAELIQFQQDRLLHNWRKAANESNPYPRFEAMATRFEAELRKLETYMHTLSSGPLEINQCEISYINDIHLGTDQALGALGWFNFLAFQGAYPEDLTGTFRETIRDENNKPQGRLTCELNTASLAGGQPILRFALTFRGAPPTSGIDSALDFIAQGRILIVKKFTELTTKEAHSIWRRQS